MRRVVRSHVGRCRMTDVWPITADIAV